MAWVRIDDQFPDHPKILAVGPTAAWLFVSALCYCNRLLTDGFIPINQVARLLPEDMDTPSYDLLHNIQKRLCDCGLWEKAEKNGCSGFLIHDYHDYQPSRESVLKERKQTHERVSRWRQRNGVSNAPVTQLQMECNGVSNALVTPPPIPIPSTKIKAVASPPLNGNGSGTDGPEDNIGVITKIAHEAIEANSSAELGDLADAVKKLCAKRRITYDSAVVAKAVDSALVQRSR